MQLYHGSSIAGLATLSPRLSNHERPYVYLTDSAALALLYAHNPIARPGGFFPYWFDQAGRLHYDEYFPDQARIIYEGREGWIYRTEDCSLPHLDRMPWVYLSAVPVQILGTDHIPDLYSALLATEKADHIIIHRYGDFTAEQQERHRQIVRRSLDGPTVDDYLRFLRQYMPELF